MRLSVPILCAAVLLGAGVTPSRATRYDELAVAAQAGDATKLRSLLDSGANPNDYDGTYSALMYAAGNGHVEAVRILLARGANVDHRDHNGDRALLWAAQHGHADVVRLLLAGRAAVESNADPHLITPLMQACRYGHLAAARVLIAAGADSRRRDHVNDTALHAAAISGNAELVALLLRAGADPNAKGKYLDDTPLHHAADFDRVEAARLLVSAGAHLDVRDHKGRTPLWSAASLDHPAIVEILLAGGADPDARDTTGTTPFVAAAGRSGTAARLLVERTRDIDRGFAAAVWGGHADLALRLAGRGADVNAADDLGRPALAGAALHQGAELLDWFLGKGVDLPRHGVAALLYAAETGRVDLTRKLLDVGVPVDARDAAGATALHIAAGAGRVEMVQLLLERGADRGVRDAQGRGVEDYMSARTGIIDLSIKQRQASRALHPVKHLADRLENLQQNHATIKALLAR